MGEYKSLIEIELQREARVARDISKEHMGSQLLAGKRVSIAFYFLISW